MTDKDVNTITVPYIPFIGTDGNKVRLGIDQAKEYVKSVLNKNPDFYLSDIYGGHICLIDDEWVDIGWKVILTREKES